MFIVLEGSDGSGKTTQFKLLTERLKAAGHDVEVYDFPRYDEPSSYFVKRYLNGEYGPASEVSPYTASLFYALDRFEAAPLIRQSLADGKIVLANRYAGSNMAHQGAKFSNSGQKRGYFVWADSLEFQLLGIPRPDINIFLRVPAEVAYELIKKKSARSYTAKVHDEHEGDIEHLRQSVATYDTLCQLFPKDYQAIECTNKGKIMPVTEINNKIWDLLKPLLPKPTHVGHSAVVQLQASPKSDPKPGTASAADGKQTTIKDVSLLTIVNLISSGAKIDYSLKWSTASQKPRIKYYIPSAFPPKLSAKYRRVMDKLSTIHGKLVEKGVPTEYLDLAVPLAALADAQIGGSRQPIDQLLSRAASKNPWEVKQIAKQALVAIQQPQPLKQIIAQISKTGIGFNGSGDDEHVKLVNAHPRNELELLVDCLYPQSNLGPAEIAAELDRWPYTQKSEALKALLRSDPAGVFGKCRYHFEVVDDIRALLNWTAVFRPQELQVQAPTPRFGYRVPEAIDQFSAEDLFIQCFDLSFGLYSDIQAAGLEELAGYAVLAGHKQRWQLIVDDRGVFQSQSGQKRAVSMICENMRAKIAEVHPLVSQVLEAPSSRQRNKSNKKTSQRQRTSKSTR